MYKDFYQLKSAPFSTHPDPGVIFISKTHKEAWDYLLSSMETQEPYLLLTGEYGMGKTLLCLRLIQVLRKTGKPPVEYIATPNEGYDGILRRIASGLGISTIPEEVSILQRVIYDHFRIHDCNIRICLMIDDAQELDQSTLSRLKQLSTFNHNGFFPVSIIFVAHPSFLEELKTPALSSLNQRIKRRYHLSRFSFDDTKNYIYFRLLKSGSTGIPAFPEESLQKIFTASGGVPRLINNICDTCLLIGASGKLTTIPLSVVAHSLTLVDGSLAGTESGICRVPGTADETDACITVSEPVQGWKDVDPDASMLTQGDKEMGQSENSREKVPGFGRKLRQIAMLAAAALLLMAVGALISRLFLKDDQISAVFYPDKLPEKHQIISESPALEPVDSHAVQPVSGNEPLQPESSGREDLSIRNEMDSKSPAELLPPAGQTETLPADTAAHSSKDIPGADMELPQKTELPLSENTESGFLPYSLRSSSYKQPFRAERELAEIRQMGLAPYLVRADLGEVGVWWRVYIGFYATDEAALKAKALYNLSHVTIQKTDYACQLGEFSAETELSPLFDKLKQTDFFPYVIQKGKDSFLLYVGAYERKRDAESDHRKLLKKGFNNNIVKR